MHPDFNPPLTVVPRGGGIGAGEAEGLISSTATFPIGADDSWT